MSIATVDASKKVGPNFKEFKTNHVLYIALLAVYQRNRRQKKVSVSTQCDLIRQYFPIFHPLISRYMYFLYSFVIYDFE